MPDKYKLLSLPTCSALLQALTLGTDAIERMATRQQAVQKTSYNLMDVGNLLTGKVDEHRYTLQDISFFLLHREYQQGWEQRKAIDQIARILDLLGNLIATLKENDWVLAKSYTEAIYEIAFLVTYGVPEPLAKTAKDEERRESSSRQEELENKLRDVTIQLVQWLEKVKWRAFGVEETVFSIIGLAAAAFRTTGRSSLKAWAISGIGEYGESFRDPTKHEECRDQQWDYLQLCTAWSRGLLSEGTLADKLTRIVAEGRPFRFDHFLGSSSRWASMGYPTGELGMDFHLAVPRNVAHLFGEAERTAFEQWQGLAVESAMLTETYKSIEIIREPIREEIVRRRNERKEQPPA